MVGNDDKGKEGLMSHDLHAKEWNLNTLKTLEAVILLDLVATLKSKSRNINQGIVEVHMDNKNTWRRTNTTTRVANHHNQDSSEETITKKKLIKEADLDVGLIREQGHREVRQTFHLNPGPKLIHICDQKQKKV